MLDPLSVSLPLSSPSRPQRPALPQKKLLKPSPDHPDDYVIELDYSTISSFMECPRKFENYAIRGREAARDATATSFGSLFHRLEETRLREGKIVDFNLHVKQQKMIEEHFVASPSPAGDHRTADRMMQVLTQYNNIYSSDGYPKKIFSDANGPFIERPFKIELATVEVNGKIPYHPYLLTKVGNPSDNFLFVRSLHILYTGRIDAILEEAGKLWIVDHKTSSRGGREFEEAFRLSLQTRGYCWAGQKITGRDVLGLIMNSVVVRPLTKTGTGTEFNRVNYWYSQDSLDEWEDNMRAIVSDLVAMLLRGYFPQTARSFKSPCAGCDYSENCTLPRNQRPADLASDLYRDVTWSPINE